MAENLYKVWNVNQTQGIRTDKIVGAQVVGFNMQADEVIDVYESERGPTMMGQLEVGVLNIVETIPGQTPPSVSIGVTPDQKDALNGANAPEAANVFATMADVHGWDNTVLANVIWVTKGGHDTTGDGTITKPYLTITKAVIDDAGAGNVILVLPGTYAETIDVTDKVHVVGLIEDSVFIITSADARGVIQVGAVTGGAKGVIFERLTVANQSNVAGACALEVLNTYNNIGGVKFMDGILSNSGTANGKALIVNAGAANTLYLDVAGRNQFIAGDVDLTHAAGAGVAKYVFSSVNAENSNLDIDVGAGRVVQCISGTKFLAGQPTIVSGTFYRDADWVSTVF